MPYNEDVEYSADALEEAERSIEAAIAILPVGKLSSMVPQLTQALEAIRDVRKRLRQSEARPI